MGDHKSFHEKRAEDITKKYTTSQNATFILPISLGLILTTLLYLSFAASPLVVGLFVLFLFLFFLAVIPVLDKKYNWRLKGWQTAALIVLSTGAGWQVARLLSIWISF